MGMKNGVESVGSSVVGLLLFVYVGRTLDSLLLALFVNIRDDAPSGNV